MFTRILFALLLGAMPFASVADAEVVKIDLAANTGPVTYRASGFLHAMSTSQPDLALIKPLKPRMFRMRGGEWATDGTGGFANYDRIKALGARLQIVLSDSHGYSDAGWWPGDDGDWSRWEATVEGLVKHAKSRGCVVQWDIWNEPDHKYFWAPDFDRFLEMWKRSVRKIRALDTKAVIVGPSTAGFRTNLLDKFLLYAKENDVLPNILSWHELNSKEGGYRPIPDHVTRMREFMKEHQIKIDRISINEIIGPGHQYNPGAAVWFFHLLEKAGVESACHACWGDEDNMSNCDNQTLDGILTYPERKPRSTWWAYKGYGDITGRLLQVEPSQTVAAVAGLDPRSGEVRVVLGRDGGTAGAVEVLLAGAGRFSGGARVTASRIPASGPKALSAPTPVIDEDIAVSNGVLRVSLPDFGASDAYMMTVKTRRSR